MFTGLVRDIGSIVEIHKENGGQRAVIAVDALDLDAEKIGASIACSGCCLTVTDKTAQQFTVEISAETLDKTNLGDWRAGTRINLEPSLRMGDELGGHLVSGHIDGLAQILDIAPVDISYKITLKSPHNLLKYIAEKGSITLDGISLTINAVDGDCFSVNIIPHTWQRTTLRDRKTGDNVNIEIDMLARYVERMLGTRP